MSPKNRKIFTGSFFILLGSLFLLENFQVITLSFCKNFHIYWPVFIILIGLSTMFKTESVTMAIVILFAVCGVSSLIDFDTNYNYETIQKGFNNESLTYAKVNIMTSGRLNINSGDKTFDSIIQTPNKEFYTFENENGIISLKNNKRNHNMFNGEFLDSVNVTLSDKTKYDLYIEYGIGDSTIDLTNIEVNELSMDTGVSDVKLIMGPYDSNVDINVGVSELDMYFPKEVNVIIKQDTGISDFDAYEFEIINGVYYSNPNNDYNKTINVYIEAGVSDISAYLR